MKAISNHPNTSARGLTGRSILLLAQWSGSITINKIRFLFDYPSGQLIHQRRPTVKVNQFIPL